MVQRTDRHHHRCKRGSTEGRPRQSGGDRRQPTARSNLVGERFFREQFCHESIVAITAPEQSASGRLLALDRSQYNCPCKPPACTSLFLDDRVSCAMICADGRSPPVGRTLELSTQGTQPTSLRWRARAIHPRPSLPRCYRECGSS
jgi:hypothetical protein